MLRFGDVDALTINNMQTCLVKIARLGDYRLGDLHYKQGTYSSKANDEYAQSRLRFVNKLPMRAICKYE